MRLLLGTRNPGKVREYRPLLPGLELVQPREQGIEKGEPEAANSLEENARAKALFYAGKGGLLTLAEDSGLFVDALGGAPGVLSARYGPTDEDRVARLLARLEGVPTEKRQASFRCIIALARPGEIISTFSGEVAGLIALEPRGTGGFGYDPVFLVPALGKTLAELPLEEKNRVSHRGQAARQAFALLEPLAKVP